MYLIPSEVFAGALQESVLGLHLFIYYSAVQFYKAHKIFFCLPTLKIAHSISSATDSTLSQSNMDSVCGWCAADFMNLVTEESKVQC